MDAILTSFCKGPWKAYCISLPRCQDRRDRFRQWATTHQLPFTFWDAVDKRTLTTATVFSGNSMSLGATGCRLSHEALWHHCLAEDKTTQCFFILEDDAGFKQKSLKDMKQFLDGVSKVKNPWSLVQLGFGTMTGSELHRLSKRVPPGIFKVDFSDQMHAVLYTRQAIQDLLHLAENPSYQKQPSDGLLLTYILKKKGNVYAPAESIVEQTDTISYINLDWT